VLDSIGARTAQFLACLRVGGRLVLIGLRGGRPSSISACYSKRLSIIGSILRALGRGEARSCRFLLASARR
jgi:threonine dehydrogenase-like Zn-dependent dehydrogenase